MAEELFRSGTLYYQIELIPWNGKTSPVISTWVFDGPVRRCGHSPSDCAEDCYSYSLVVWEDPLWARSTPGKGTDPDGLAIVDSGGFAPSGSKRSFTSLEAARETMKSWGEFKEFLPCMAEKLERIRKHEAIPAADAGPTAIGDALSNCIDEALGEPSRSRGLYVRGDLYYELGMNEELGQTPLFRTVDFEGFIESSCCGDERCEVPFHFYMFTSLELRGGRWGLPTRRPEYRCATHEIAELTHRDWKSLVSQPDPAAGPEDAMRRHLLREKEMRWRL
jgi:hypothetical protein